MGDSAARPTESPGHPGAGDILDEKYRLLRVIGEGGMGIVFEAVHVRLGQRVAIKVLQPDVAKDEALVARFEREARAAGRLRGRNVARVTDVEASPGKLPYIVMEFLEGHDLEAELGRRVERRIPVGEAVDILLQACRAISEAHAAGIIHRDLKPSNLFLCDESGERVVKLLDFGVSKMEGEASKLTSTQLVIGTVYYMSPEQVMSAKRVDSRADIWALSVILYELLAGHPPFLGSTTSVAVSIVNDEPSPLPVGLDVPAGLEAAIFKAMAKNPAGRFQHVLAFARAIAPYGTLGGPSSVRWYDEASSPVVVVPPVASDAALGTARTLHESASSSRGGEPLTLAAARTSPDRATRAKGSPWPRVMAGGVAVAAAVGLIVLAASRAPASRPAPPLGHASIAAEAPPQGAPVSVPSSIAAAPDAGAAPSPPPSAPTSTSLAPGPRARHGTTPRTARPSGAAPPATASAKEKPPLVAPF